METALKEALADLEGKAVMLHLGRPERDELSLVFQDDDLSMEYETIRIKNCQVSGWKAQDDTCWHDELETFDLDGEQLTLRCRNCVLSVRLKSNWLLEYSRSKL